jgi:hypothetical protein
MSQFQPEQPPWQQPPTYYPPQQPPNPFSAYPQQQQGESPPPPYPPQYQPQMPSQQQWQPLPLYAPPPPPAAKKPGKGKFFAIGCGGLIALVVLVILIAAIASAGGNSSTAPTSNATQPTATQQATIPAKPTQAPTQSPTQIEQTYKASATNTTVADLDKDGSNGQGKIVHFTATILVFVKDDSGNTGAANVSDENTLSVLQVVFPDKTDISKLNENDTLEVWGTDMGVFSGPNAFGATVQELGVQAQYMTDQTTGYQAG